MENDDGRVIDFDAAKKSMLAAARDDTLEDAMREMGARMMVQIVLYDDNTLEYSLTHDRQHYERELLPVEAWTRLIGAGLQTVLAGAMPEEANDGSV
jgi:hypothetical protein